MFTNMTNEECFRLHNTLPADRIAKLLDESANKVDPDDIPFDEILAQFPEEDFASTIETRLQELTKRLRGDNRTELMSIIESLQDLAQCQFYATEYARSVVDDFLAGKS